MDLSRLLKRLDLTGVSITAQVNPQGALDAVGEVFEKLLAAARERSFPRVHTVVIAHNQLLNAAGLVVDPQNPNLLRDPSADFHIIRAEKIWDVPNLLDANATARWGHMDCSLAARDPDFVGRDRLFTYVRDFIEGHDSGYLVLVGGMGRGKTAFMTELLHRAVERCEQPVFHIVGRYGSETSKPHSVAACLYNRLRRKRPEFREPDAWANLDVEAKLEKLLQSLSEGELGGGQKEVLYIDAADQAEAGAAAPLLRGALRDLPRGVLCIISTRAHLGWLRAREGVELLEIEPVLDDRSDVRAYLHRRGRHLSPPLPDPFVEQVVSQPDPPVFFTVESLLRQLENPGESSSRKTELREKPGIWAMPAEARVEDEACRRVGEAAGKGITEETFWQTLGLLAVSQEDLSEEQLAALGLCREESQTRCLRQQRASSNAGRSFGSRSLPIDSTTRGIIEKCLSISVRTRSPS